MSTQTAEPVEMGTKPVQEHAWLQKLVGEWRVETEMSMGPGEAKERSEGSESITSLGGLWAIGKGTMSMPGGGPMTFIAAIGYDLTFKEYRSCWIASVSSHLWRKAGQLSADGRILTLTGEGPDMQRDGELTNYRDVIEIIDGNHFTMTHYDQDAGGGWKEYLKSQYSRK